LFPWGLILQAVALVHFIKRRPDGVWLWIHLGEFAGAVPDLESVTSRDPKYDFHRAIGLLAHAYARTNQPEKAEALFAQATGASTLSETYLNYASFLAAGGRAAEARDWTQKVLNTKASMPRYLQRRERRGSGRRARC
jgi:hypothetical protein